MTVFEQTSCAKKLLLWISPRLNLFIGFQRITILMIPPATAIVVRPSCFGRWLRGRTVCSKDVNAAFDHEFHGLVQQNNPVPSLIHHFHIQVSNVPFLHFTLIRYSYLAALQNVIDTSEIGIFRRKRRICLHLLRYASPQKRCPSWVIRTVNEHIFFTIVYMQLSGRKWIYLIVAHYILPFNSIQEKRSWKQYLKGMWIWNVHTAIKFSCMAESVWGVFVWYSESETVFLIAKLRSTDI